MRILLTGAQGQLGWELQRSLQPIGEVLASTRESLDLRDLRELQRQFDAGRPDIVVNAAAFAAVDQAQSHADEAYAVNARAVAAMAEYCRARGALLVHYSTDYVFDGMSPVPYSEDMPPSPVNVYGESKMAGDQAVLASGAKHLILRISWLYSLRRRNFLRAVLRQAQAGRALRVVGDQRSTPTPAWLVADLSAHLIDRAWRGEEQLLGLTHLACAGDASWHEFATEIFAQLARAPALMQTLGLDRMPSIENIGSHQYETAARRPLDTRLALARLCRSGIHTPHWRDALAYTLERLVPVDPD